MITFTRPGWNEIRRYIDARRDVPVTYGQPGLTWPDTTGSERLESSTSRSRFQRDACRVCLGQGEAVFAAAQQAIRDWKMFPEPMAEVFWPTPNIEEGYVVAVLFRGPGFWSLNPCRIIHHLDQPRRFGFAYGTLDGHLESGEESFVVHWRDDDTVWYELTAYSRPRHWMAWLGYPVVRREQARFRQLSTASIRAYIQRRA